MEYYILKKYEEEKGKSSEVEQGYNRYPIKTRRIIYTLLGIMFSSCVVMVILFVLAPLSAWYLISGGICFISMAGLFKVDSIDQKKRLDKYINSYGKKIDILNNVLVNTFNISTKKKVNILIEKYQKYIDKCEKEEKRRNAIIGTMFSVAVGITSTSFANIETAGIDFGKWLLLIAFIFVITILCSVMIHSQKYFDTLKKKYKVMIKDLEDLRLIKY